MIYVAPLLMVRTQLFKECTLYKPIHHISFIRSRCTIRHAIMPPETALLRIQLSLYEVMFADSLHYLGKFFFVFTCVVCCLSLYESNTNDLVFVSSS